MSWTTVGMVVGAPLYTALLVVALGLCRTARTTSRAEFHMADSRRRRRCAGSSGGRLWMVGARWGTRVI